MYECKVYLSDCCSCYMCFLLFRFEILLYGLCFRDGNTYPFKKTKSVDVSSSIFVF